MACIEMLHACTYIHDRVLSRKMFLEEKFCLNLQSATDKLTYYRSALCKGSGKKSLRNVHICRSLLMQNILAAIINQVWGEGGEEFEGLREKIPPPSSPHIIIELCMSMYMYMYTHMHRQADGQRDKG